MCVLVCVVLSLICVAGLPRTYRLAVFYQTDSSLRLTQLNSHVFMH